MGEEFSKPVLGKLSETCIHFLRKKYYSIPTMPELETFLKYIYKKCLVYLEKNKSSIETPKAPKNILSTWRFIMDCLLVQASNNKQDSPPSFQSDHKLPTLSEKSKSVTKGTFQAYIQPVLSSAAETTKLIQAENFVISSAKDSVFLPENFKPTVGHLPAKAVTSSKFFSTWQVIIECLHVYKNSITGESKSSLPYQSEDKLPSKRYQTLASPAKAVRDISLSMSAFENKRKMHFVPSVKLCGYLKSFLYNGG